MSFLTEIHDWTYQGCPIRRKVFQDLWHQGFYVTDGTKFGGDFLAYPGDPIHFHATYIVSCCDKKAIEQMDEKDLVAKSRLGCNVNKTVLLAYIQEDQVKYKSVKWNKNKN